MRISKRLIRNLPAFNGLSIFDKPAAEYKRSVGCRKFKKPLCWGCSDFELVSRKCTKYDAKNAYVYVKNYQFGHMYEAGGY